MNAFYYNIDPYQITAAGMQLKVLSLDDGAYRIIQNERPVNQIFLYEV